MEETISVDAYQRQRLETLLIGVQQVYNFGVLGDVAEFGTASGTTSRLLARAIAHCDVSCRHHVEKELGKPKDLHLFDSFCGLPDVTADPVDGAALHVRSGIWGTGAMKGLGAAALKEECQRYLPAPRLHTHEGWYKDTVPALPHGSLFGLLHVDCDLFSSTVDALQPLFARQLIAKGAFLFFDDWNTNAASPQLGQRLAWDMLTIRFHIQSSDAGEYGLGGHRFIIHSYRDNS